MIVDHIGLAISDSERSKTFYAKCLSPLGISLLIEVEGWAGFGRGDKAEFWFGVDKTPQHPMHIAFLADTRDQVRQFHAAALAAGGKDNGAPGLRDYRPNYYGAFIIDPDGHNIEAVCHTPEL